jgi:hypothetical protein
VVTENRKKAREDVLKMCEKACTLGTFEYCNGMKPPIWVVYTACILVAVVVVFCVITAIRCAMGHKKRHIRKIAPVENTEP